MGLARFDQTMQRYGMIAEAAQAQGLTSAEALLSVLAPFATALTSLAGLFMRRHFKHLDAVEADIKARSAAELIRAKVDAEIATELRLNRESRVEHAAKLSELEQKLAAKIDGTRDEVVRRIDDNQLSDLHESVKDLSARVSAGGVGVGLLPMDDPRSQRRPAPSQPELPSPRTARSLGR